MPEHATLRPAAGDAGDHAGEELDAFLLPVSGLFADLEAGFGRLSPDDSFAAAPAMRQLQVLQGWQRSIEQLREHALVKLYGETCGRSPLALPQRMEQFRDACAQRGIACPADMATLLQRYPY